MKSFLAIITGFAATLLLGVGTIRAQDTDDDGVSDQVESQLLSLLSPTIIAPEGGYAPPLPLDWYVRHCRLAWYVEADTNSLRIGDTAETPLDPDTVLNIISTHKANGLTYAYRLEFKVDAHRNGNDPDDKMTWEKALTQSVYGRVCPNPDGQPNRYKVQFFWAFGWNETDTPLGCDYGNHEGDWQCIDLNVDASDPSTPTITDGVFHNHGRQIFIESDTALQYDGTHPRVYPERGTNESWPYPGTAGFDTSLCVPPCISTNEVFHAKEYFGVVFGGEKDGYQVTREHEGKGAAYQIGNVTNVGEATKPYPSDAARFFQDFDGWYGNEWNQSCYGLDGPGKIKSPPGPPYQSKMWNRKFSTIREWHSRLCGGLDIIAIRTNPSNGLTYLLLECSSWGAAREFAHEVGGTLPTVRSETENQWLWTTLVPLATHQLYGGVWIGAFESEGQWHWDSGEAWGKYTNWADGEPSNGPDENYARIPVAYGWNWHGQWGDAIEDPEDGYGCDAAINGAVELKCYPDMNADDSLDLFDFLEFVNFFNEQSIRVDCDENNSLDLFDFLCFVNAFNKGCS